MAKKIFKRTIVNKKMSPVYFDKNLYMKETNNHAMFFFKRKHTTPYYKLYVIIYVMNIHGVINDHLWYRHTAEM